MKRPSGSNSAPDPSSATLRRPPRPRGRTASAAVGVKAAATTGSCRRCGTVRPNMPNSRSRARDAAMPTSSVRFTYTVICGTSRRYVHGGCPSGTGTTGPAGQQDRPRPRGAPPRDHERQARRSCRRFAGRDRPVSRRRDHFGTGGPATTGERGPGPVPRPSRRYRQRARPGDGQSSTCCAAPSRGLIAHLAPTRQNGCAQHARMLDAQSERGPVTSPRSPASCTT